MFGWGMSTECVDLFMKLVDLISEDGAVRTGMISIVEL
jgi:hypothetical protein